jgi:N-formylmaleamate deformylase
MLNYTQGDVNINGIKIHYYRTGGNKPPFILLHGATDNGLCWTPVAEILAGDYDVIMPDAQGHGLSDRLDKSFSSKNHALQVVELMKQLGLVKPIIMGHSMGAGTTVDIASGHSELLKAVILEDPAWQIEGQITDEQREEMRKQREEMFQASIGYRKHTREEIIAECKVTNPRWSEAEILPWADSKLQFDPTLLAAIQPNMHSYVELVPKIQCPTLLIISDGGIVSAETARHASKLWKAKTPLRWIQIKNAGHNIRREQFKIFCETLLSFLHDYNTNK